MADFTFTIPDDILDDTLNEFCATHGYREQIDNPAFAPGNDQEPQLILNPIGKKTHLVNVVIKFIQDSVKVNIVGKAVDTERKKVVTEVDNKYILTAKPTVGGADEEPLEP